MKDMKNKKLLPFMVDFSLALACRRSGLGSEAALEAKRPWKRGGLGSKAAFPDYEKPSLVSNGDLCKVKGSAAAKIRKGKGICNVNQKPPIIGGYKCLFLCYPDIIRAWCICDKEHA
jgi:hypothetical protein